MIRTVTHRKHQYTPLRYPGGKTSLFLFFDEIIKKSNWSGVKYIEPYAGGAGAALSLLILGGVDSIVINDYDPAIYAFWKSILDNTDNFLRKIDSTAVTVEEWKRQKEIYKNSDDLFDLGFATFFINRTNRSGVMNGGPIGGLDQSGNYKINARYNKESLIAKIHLISSYRDQITVANKDGVEIINEYVKRPDSFFYIDPPYFKQGKGLYMNFFNYKQHEDLARVLKRNRKARWILTYDNEPEILELYSDFKEQWRLFNLRYSARNYRNASELMFFSDNVFSYESRD